MESALSVLIIAGAFLLFTLGILSLSYARKISKSWFWDHRLNNKMKLQLPEMNPVNGRIYGFKVKEIVRFVLVMATWSRGSRLTQIREKRTW